MTSRALSQRVEKLERGRKLDLPLVVSEDCPGRKGLVVEAKRQGRAVLILSPLDERL